MTSQGQRHVTLTGDLSGDYVVVEERSDGSLVVAPDTSTGRRPAARRPAPQGATALFSGLFTRPKPAPANVPETLEGWGVELGEDEPVVDFLIADIDDKTGFLAITNQRFIFVGQTGHGLGVVHEHVLSAARNVEVVRRRRRQKLSVTWHGAEMQIAVFDKEALSRLQSHLGGDQAS